MTPTPNDLLAGSSGQDSNIKQPVDALKGTYTDSVGYPNSHTRPQSGGTTQPFNITGGKRK